jgi:hypothetical protein
MIVGITDSTNITSEGTPESVRASLTNLHIGDVVDEDTARKIDLLVQQAQKGANASPERWGSILEKALEKHGEARVVLIQQKAKKLVETPKEPEVKFASEYDDLDEDSLRNLHRNATISLIKKLQDKEKAYAS